MCPWMLYIDLSAPATNWVATCFLMTRIGFVLGKMWGVARRKGQHLQCTTRATWLSICGAGMQTTAHFATGKQTQLPSPILQPRQWLQCVWDICLIGVCLYLLIVCVCLYSWCVSVYAHGVCLFMLIVCVILWLSGSFWVCPVSI